MGPFSGVIDLRGMEGAGDGKYWAEEDGWVGVLDKGEGEDGWSCWK